jgi:hypothetical protein
MFLNPTVRINNAISNVNLTTQNNELYENGIRVATQTDINTLQQEINNIIPDNPYGWLNSDGITTTDKLIPITDGTSNGMKTDPNLSYEIASVFDRLEPTLTVGAAKIISSLNNMKLETPDYIMTNKDFYLQGTQDVQRSLTIGCLNQTDNVKTYVDITTADYICDNQLATKTEFRGATGYYFDNDVRIGSATNIRKLFVNDIVVLPGVTGSTGPTGDTGPTGYTGPAGSGVSNGMLRALNLNLLVPTVAQTFDVVWSNLSPAEQLLWKGGDAATADPIASASGNYWSFVKSAPSANKINWTLPIDLSAYTFQDLQSVWAIVRINNNTTINAEGQLWFQIQTNPPTTPNFYRTRWNYSNSATPINQFQYFYKIHALDTITTTSTANLGKGQEVGQTKFKGNPCDVEPNLWSIGFNKFVGSPTGDTSANYTQAPILSVALNTASNIHTYSFDVVAIGVNNIRYNLFFA